MSSRDAFGRDAGPAPPPHVNWPGRTLALAAVVLVAGLGWLVTGFHFGRLAHIHLPQVAGLGDDKPATPPAGLSRHSMLRRGNLSPALRELHAKLGGRLRFVRVDALRVDVEVVGADGGTRLAQRRWDAGGPPIVRHVPSTAAGRTFAWSAIDASAPARLVRATTQGRRTTDFQYAVLVDAAGLRWTGSTLSRGGFLADGRGLGVTPLRG